MNAQSPTLRTFEAQSVATIAAATEITLQVDTVRRNVQIKRVMVKRDAGTGTTFQPSIGNATGYTTLTVGEKYLGSSTAVADLLDDTNIEGFCQTDANGRLYLRFVPNAGADNQFTYAISILVF